MSAKGMEIDSSKVERRNEAFCSCEGAEEGTFFFPVGERGAF